MTSSLPSHQIYTKLRGVLAVYKHANVSVSSTSRKIQEKLSTDLNTNYERIQKKMVRFLPIGEVTKAHDSSTLLSPASVTSQVDILDLVPTNVPDLFDHAAVQGPRYQPGDFEINTYNSLDLCSSGVQVFGLQAVGKELIKQIHLEKLPRFYHVHGRFGVATTKFDRDSKVIHKSTYEHITRSNINAFLRIVHSSHRNALLESSGHDLESQLGYEMASKGLLKPEQTRGPIILHMKLESLDLPNFTLDVVCMNESCQFLRQLVDEIGTTLKSSAVCTGIQRYRDGIFLTDDESTLLSRDITAQKVIDVTSQNFERLKSLFAKDSLVYHDWPKQMSGYSKRHISKK